MSIKMRILIAEDDKNLCNAMGIHLKNAGYAYDCCYDGETACYYAMQNAYDLILLDWMLPKMDGIQVLASLKEENIGMPVLMITALNAVGDRVVGLDAGADDYLTKPFAIEELLARVRALARRPQKMEWDSKWNIGDIIFDFLQKELNGVKGKSILSKTEAVMLDVFLKNPGQTLPRELLYMRVWGPDTSVEEQSVDNYVHFVRRRLKSVGSVCTIKTIRSVGYRFEVSE